MALDPDALARARAGTLPLNTLLRQITPDMTRLAHKLIGRRALPAWIAVDDVVQVMLFGVVRALPLWRPESPVGLVRFTVYRACMAGRRLIQAQTEAHVQDGLVVAAGHDGEGAEGLQERILEVHQLMAQLPQTPLQEAVLGSVLRTQNIDTSMRELMRDPRTRLAFAVADDMARHKIRRVLTVLAKRAAEG